MAASLLVHERIETTHAKALELRSIVEKLITKASRAGENVGQPLDKLSIEERARQVHLRRLAGRFLPHNYEKNGEPVDPVQHLFDVIGPRYKTRPGGYTRVTKLGHRRGDNAPLAIIELVSEN